MQIRAIASRTAALRPAGNGARRSVHCALRRTSVAMASAGEPTINFEESHGRIFVGSCLRNAADADL
jgi:hypothetical protein